MLRPQEPLTLSHRVCLALISPQPWWGNPVPRQLLTASAWIPAPFLIAVAPTPITCLMWTLCIVHGPWFVHTDPHSLLMKQAGGLWGRARHKWASCGEALLLPPAPTRTSPVSLHRVFQKEVFSWKGAIERLILLAWADSYFAPLKKLQGGLTPWGTGSLAYQPWVSKGSPDWLHPIFLHSTDDDWEHILSSWIWWEWENISKKE